MNYAVVAENLTKKIGGFTAVDNISFSVPVGEIFGFLGSNGAGKTTTIRMLCGIIEPTGGSANVLGLDIVRDRNAIKEQIGYMSQKFSLYNDLTVRENLEFFAGMYNSKGNRRERINEALETTGLVKRARAITGSLPFGIKQRLAFASAMLHRPRIVFLDEPTAGVDPRGRREFWDLIHRVASEGVTVFVTTHYMDEAEYCHRVTLMHKGQLRAVGSPAELKRSTMKGAMLEISCDNPAGAIGLLKAAGIGETALFANKIHINVREESAGREHIARLLAERKIAVDGIEHVAPTLEDVFISVLSEEGERQ
jgi:ABC-2 type transport system ATP-binding protein